MRRLLVTIAALAGLLSIAPAAQAATLQGQVVMGTEGAALPETLEVMVLRINESGDPEDPTPAVILEGGGFRFETDDGSNYVVGTFHDSIPYSALVTAGSTDPIELRIFESGAEIDAIKITSDSLTIGRGQDDEGDILEVLQLLQVSNTSDRTFTGPPGDETARVLSVPVPESIFDLSPTDPSNPIGLALDGAAIVTTVPIPPGEISIPFVYRVRVPRSGWQLRREVFNPTEHADLLLGPGLTLNAGPGFEFVEEVVLAETPYLRYRHGALTPGSVLSADVGFPDSSTAGLWIGASTSLVFLLTLLAAGEGVRRKRKKAARAAPEPSRSDLVEQIAELDERHDAGELSDEEHSARRYALLAQVDQSSDSDSDSDSDR